MTRDEEIVVFHYELGAAITQWALVEDMLRHILVTSFENHRLNRESLSVGLFSLEGFRAKLAFVEGTVSRKLAASKHLAEWKALVKKAEDYSRQRNKLAHRAIGKYWECPAGRRVALVPWKFKKTKKKTRVPRPPDGSLYIRDIQKLKLQFRALAVALENFLYRGLGQTPKHPASDEVPANPPTLQQTVKEIRGVFMVSSK